MYIILCFGSNEFVLWYIVTNDIINIPTAINFIIGIFNSYPFTYLIIYFSLKKKSVSPGS